MKLISYLLISISFPGCFTHELVQKAKYDKQYETVDKINYSNIDSSGHVTIIIKKRNSREEYLLAFNIDSLYKVYTDSKQLNLSFGDSSKKDPNGIIGIYFKDDLPASYKLPLLLFFSKKAINAIPGIDAPKVDSNYLNIDIYSNKHYMPSHYVDRGNYYIYNKQKFLTVIFKDFDRTSVRKNPLNRTFVIGIESTKKRKAKYFQLPLTVMADIVTFPFQLIAYGVILIMK